MRDAGCGMPPMTPAMNSSPYRWEKQSIGRAVLYGVLTAAENKTPGWRVHVVTHSETVYAGLRGNVQSGSNMGGWDRGDHWSIKTCG